MSHEGEGIGPLNPQMIKSHYAKAKHEKKVWGLVM